MIIPELKEILDFYRETYSVTEDLDGIYDELVSNNVEVNGNSFYCPIWNKELNAWLLLAGTKGKANLWVMKKILKLIKGKETVYSMLNGNSDYLLEKLKRYDVEILNRVDDMSYIVFNKNKE